MFVEQNPHYEIDWMGNRQKAYEEHREKKQMPLVPPPPPTIASVPSPDSGLLDSIPLQINQKPIVSTTTLPLLGAKDKDTDSIKDEKRKKKKKRYNYLLFLSHFNVFSIHFDIDLKTAKRKRKRSEERRRNMIPRQVPHQVPIQMIQILKNQIQMILKRMIILLRLIRFVLLCVIC